MFSCCMYSEGLWAENCLLRKAVSFGCCPHLWWSWRCSFAGEGNLCPLGRDHSVVLTSGSEFGQRESPHNFLLPVGHATLSRLWIRPHLTTSYDPNLNSSGPTTLSHYQSSYWPTERYPSPYLKLLNEPSWNRNIHCELTYLQLVPTEQVYQDLLNIDLEISTELDLTYWLLLKQSQCEKKKSHADSFPHWQFCYLSL